VQRRLVSDESGQVLLLTGVLMAIFLVVVALVVDIGHTRLVQRQLQAGVDAAALAGAQELPDGTVAQATAVEYSPTPGRKNAVNTVNNATTSALVRCIPSIPGCNTRYATANAITVTSTSTVPTFFAKIIGISSLTVTAKATACFPCSVRPLDIMLILDRTGSMCAGGPSDAPNANPQRCRDLDAAREGMSTFLSLMDPKLDRVGLAVTPPVVGPPAGGGDSGSGMACDKPDQNDFYFGFDTWAPWWDTSSGSYRGQDRGFYVVSSLSDDDVDNNPSDDYVIKDANGDWDLNNSSDIVSKLACTKAAGSTSYAIAIDEARHELQAHGRADVQDVIVFFTDGGANTAHDNGTHWSGNSPYFNQPCAAGVHAASLAKGDADTQGRHTAIYTIGYDLENQTSAQQRCQRPSSDGHQNTSGSAQPEVGITPQQALQAMASVPENFYYTADSNALQLLFARVAGDVLTNAARLVDNDLPDLVE
jgi:Flp pilus assembly protein TadG